MNCPPNIDPTGGKNSTPVGYDSNGNAWRIGGGTGKWWARPVNPYKKGIVKGATFAELGQRLSETTAVDRSIGELGYVYTMFRNRQE